jgi:hypothetical protein
MNDFDLFSFKKLKNIILNKVKLNKNKNSSLLILTKNKLNVFDFYFVL